MKTLIFTNQKGGTGKTTTALSVAAGLSRKGFRVLLVDLDPQGNATTAAGIYPMESDTTIYEVMKGEAEPADAIRKAPGGYDVMITDIRQSGADIELATAPGRDFILKTALADLADRYDFAILDSPPNLSIITLMGLAAADGVIIVLKSDYLALNGVSQLVNTINLVKKRLNPRINITGVLLTFYDGRKILARQIADYAEEAFPGLLFNTRIAAGVALEEAPATGQDIFTYKPTSKAAAQYAALTDEIISRT